MTFSLNQDIVAARTSQATVARRGSMPKPSRWTAEKRYEIVVEILKGKEPITQIARKHQVSDALIHRWRERF
jgi:transposase-like protein